jgi:hypothetical protein
LVHQIGRKEGFSTLFFRDKKNNRVQRDVFGWGRYAESVVPQVFELQVWYGLGLHYNTHGKYIVMETLYFFADFFIYHEPYTNETE